AFDPAGRYLYFTSSRVFDPVYDTHFHDYGFPTGTRPQTVTRRADYLPHFDPAHRTKRAPGAPVPDANSTKGETSSEKAGDEKKDDEAAEPVEIDLDGISDRVVAFPQPSGRYGPVVATKTRAFTLSFPVRGALSPAHGNGGGRLEGWAFTAERIEFIADGVHGVGVNHKGTALRS